MTGKANDHQRRWCACTGPCFLVAFALVRQLSLLKEFGVGTNVPDPGVQSQTMDSGFRGSTVVREQMR